MKRNKVLENMSYDRLSRYLSLILRHHPEVLGISLDAHGWADVDELIAGIAQKKNFNREILEEIVKYLRRLSEQTRSRDTHSAKTGRRSGQTRGILFRSIWNFSR